MNHEQLNTYLKAKAEIEDLALEVLQSRGNSCVHANMLDELTVNKDTIKAYYSEYEHQNTYHYYAEFPTSYLWNIDWREEDEAEELRRNLEALKKREQKEKEEEKKREDQYLRQYLILKKKFEGITLADARKIALDVLYRAEDERIQFVELDPDFRRVLDENFWDLLEGKKEL